jgi:hypothetical protein
MAGSHAGRGGTALREANQQRNNDAEHDEDRHQDIPQRSLLGLVGRWFVCYRGPWFNTKSRVVSVLRLDLVRRQLDPFNESGTRQRDGMCARLANQLAQTVQLKSAPAEVVSSAGSPHKRPQNPEITRN